MANYLAMNRDELTAEKAALEAKYKEFQAKGLKLNMARGKPGPHQMDLAMDLLHTNISMMPTITSTCSTTSGSSQPSPAAISTC